MADASSSASDAAQAESQDAPLNASSGEGRPASLASSSSSSGPQQSKSERGLAAILPHRDHDKAQRHTHHPCQESALAHVIGPALSIAGVHNPFAIGALREDGSHMKTYTYGRSDKVSGKGADEEQARKGDPASSIPVDGEDGGIIDDAQSRDASSTLSTAEEASVSSAASLRKRSKHGRLRSFGRSLSPWRYHHSEKEGRSSRSRGSGSWRNLSRLSRDSIDVQRDKGDSGASTQGDSDGDSVRSIAPRNNAFQEADSEDDELSIAGESDAESEKRVYRGGVRSSRAGNDVDATDRSIGMASEAEKVKAAAQAGNSELDDTKDEQKEDEDKDDEDDSDFDIETLDNTLYNAGCIDVHDAWAQPSPSVRSPADELNEQYYGPSDYDAAWKGAGPSGHDECDEGLRAPNVVIGQDYRKPSVELAGEGIDVLKLYEDSKGPAPVLSPDSTEADTKKEPTVTATTTDSDSWSSRKPPGQSNGLEPSVSQSSASSQRLVASRPIFERNRCTITLVHGDYERIVLEHKRRRRYIVASDGSEESSYAIEWTIGTVLRDGDEMLVVSVMETDTKLDAKDAKHEDKRARQEHQHIRQSMAVILARRAVAVLQRTRLAVKIACQAVHARNSRHMFIDMIDFFQPTMCVVGSRGLGSLKGVLLGSFSNYCVQKSPVPVMVARKRLKLPALPRGKSDVVSNVRRRHMRLDEATIDKDANVSEEAPIDDKEETEESKKKENNSQASHQKGDALDDSKDSTIGASSTDSSATTATGTRESDTAQVAPSSRDGSAGIQRDAAQAAALQQDDNAEADEQDQRGRDRRSRSPTN